MVAAAARAGLGGFGAPLVVGGRAVCSGWGAWRLRGKSSILYGPYRILNVGELGAANQEQRIRRSPSASALIHLQQLDRHPVMGGGDAHGLIETDKTAFQALAQGNMQGISGP